MCPEVHGARATDPWALEFAREVLRVHLRYATEVVGAFALCPFVREPDVAFGRFCVMLDEDLDLDRAEHAVLGGAVHVVHLVFPRISVPPSPFERFAAALRERLRARVSPAPVSAAFHPELSGDATTPHRLVGLLRRAPDPFVQLVPTGLHEGGTVFAGAVAEGSGDHAEGSFERLQGASLDRLVAILADIHADRARSYARFFDRDL